MRLRQNKDEIECDGCHCLTESVNCHPITKRGSYCYDCYEALETKTSRVDIRRDDHEPAFAHQVERDNPKPAAVQERIDADYADYYFGNEKEKD